jgi:MAE_28990/MAE_18760-like HEPN
MFPDLRLEVMDRFTALEQFFRRSSRSRGQHSQTARGLAFVQVYAIHEYTVVTVVRLAVEAISAHGPSYSSLRPSLLAIFLNAELSSVRDCGSVNIWDRRISIFERAHSNSPIGLPAIPLPTDGSHFRHTHIELILKVLGIKRSPTARRRHLFRIDEVVENRNSIAHGDKTPEEVGRGYSNGDIGDVIRQMKSACLRLILITEEHCADPTAHIR